MPKLPASSDGGGQCFATPDVCKTPAPPGPPVPVPYPNMAMLTDATGTSSKVKICNKKAVHKGSSITRSSGDEAGVAGGVVSNQNMGPVAFKQGSSKVKIEGNEAIHLLSPTSHNGNNANAPGGMQVSPSQIKVLVDDGSGGGGSSTLKGVSREELELAASPGSSKAQIRARKKIAKRFYKQQGKMGKKEAQQHMKGIDYRKPVKIGPPPPCPSPQSQWQVPGGRQGQYYADRGIAPTNLGIHDRGLTESGLVRPKVAVQYNIQPGTPYMESTAARIRDTWSIRGHGFSTEGGAIQRFIPRAAGGVSAL